MPCKAIVLIGPRKGETCTYPPQEDGYCGRHKRNKEYDNLVSEGKHPCRMFFRGCNEITEVSNTACAGCKAKKHASNSCKHDGCDNNSKENGYCGKHKRDVYRDREKVENIRYCDIDRGCLNLCKPNYASCEDCLNKENMSARARYEKRGAMHGPDDKSVCCYCGCQFDKFLTRFGHPSRACGRCAERQRVEDAKHVGRVRNYAAEKYRNIEASYNEYKRTAAKKNREFTLLPEEFTALVLSSCHYCNYSADTEIIGIDRVDNSKDYTTDNVVPACKNCNNIKFIYPTEFFLEHCRDIIHKSEIETPSAEWRRFHKKHDIPYSQYRWEAINVNKREWGLTPAHYSTFQRQPCYICNYSASSVGIDRKDPLKGYTPENSMPCCTPCNMMKKDMPYDAFIAHVQRIVDTNAS